MSEVFALYDISGIQKYIFETNKLKQILGASEIVRSVLKEKAEEISKGFGKVLYSGGGNAIFSFKDKSAYHEFNKLFSRKLLMYAPGISFYTVCTKSKGEIKDCISNLFNLMAIEKNIKTNSCSFQTLPPMAQCSMDNQQITHIVKEFDKDKDRIETEYFSFSAKVKNEAGQETIKERYKDKELKDIKLLEEIAAPFIKDENSTRKEQNMMAIVHIDGNNMGKIFQSVLKQIRDVEEIKNISDNIDKAFCLSHKEILKKLPTLPFRLIYQNGDDVTFICHSAYALQAVQIFFEKLNSFKEYEHLEELSATAGIAFIKPKYPFDRAYEIAEKMCKSAKTKAKEHFKNLKETLDVGCWLDFEIVYGTDNIIPLQEDSEGSKAKEQKGLETNHLGPYYVSGLSKEKEQDLIKTNLGVLISILKFFESDSIARSKLKELRNAFVFKDMEYVAQLICSTGQSLMGDYKLYTGKVETGTYDFSLNDKGAFGGDSNIFPVYDALNIMDIYKVVIW